MEYIWSHAKSDRNAQRTARGQKVRAKYVIFSIITGIHINLLQRSCWEVWRKDTHSLFPPKARANGSHLLQYFLGLEFHRSGKKEFQHQLGTCTLASNRCNTTTNKARHTLLQYFQSDMISPTGVWSQLGLRPRPATHELPPNTSPLAGNSLSRRWRKQSMEGRLCGRPTKIRDARFLDCH